MKNLNEGLQEELNRCREVLGFYERIPQGAFGAMHIKQSIKDAESAIANGDTIKMMQCLEVLRSVE